MKNLSDLLDQVSNILTHSAILADKSQELVDDLIGPTPTCGESSEKIGQDGKLGGLSDSLEALEDRLADLSANLDKLKEIL